MTLRLQKDGAIARLLIDRAAKRNAFTQAMWRDFPARLDEAMSDRDIRVMLLQAAERDRAFCAGADIGELAAGDARDQDAIHAVQHALNAAPKPTIAVIEGDCIGGGCGLAMACDIRISGPAARFGITPAKLGIVYSLHDTKLLTDLVGPSQAARLLFTADLIDAREAARIGLVTILADDPYAAAAEMAAKIASRSAHSQRNSKAFIGRIFAGQHDDDADTLAIFNAAFEGPDFTEGLAAFIEKRAPDFSK